MDQETRRQLELSISSKLSLPDIYAQLAKECFELAEAALKLCRYHGSNNPPVEKDHKALALNLAEELSDVQLVADILAVKASQDVMDAKLVRWCERLGLDVRGDDGQC